jgi:predicted permease
LIRKSAGSGIGLPKTNSPAALTAWLPTISCWPGCCVMPAMLLQNTRYAVRSLFKNPGFSLIAVITLALGIGANTALFSAVDALMLRPLPFKDADRLVRVTNDLTRRGVRDVGISAPELFDYRDRLDIFESISGLFPVNANLTQVEEPERIEVQLVSPNYFALLGVVPQLGRLFSAADETPGITEIAVISDGLWKRRFGADPNVLGKKVRLDEDMYTIIGVTPPGFHHPGRGLQGDAEMWSPAGYMGSPFNQPPRFVNMLQGGLGRLKPGITLQVAQQKLDALALSLRAEYPNDYPATNGWAPRLIGLQEDLFGNVRTPLLVLLSSVGALLLIACVNVANLLLARASVRQREFAIRAAMGASRPRLAAQMLTESIVLALAAGVVGTMLAAWSLEALKVFIPQNIPHVSEVAINLRVLSFAIGVSLATGLLFGVAPALQRNANVYETLKDRARSSAGGDRRLRQALVVAEFAMAMVLLIAASLLIRSFWNLQDVRTGFNADQVLTARLWMPQPNIPADGPYFKHPARLALFQRALEKIRAIPGVQSAGWVFQLPFAGRRGSSGFLVEGRSLESANISAAEPNMADAGFFKALQIPLLRGRLFSDADTDTSPPVLLISESFAKQFFPDEDPIGKRIRPGNRNSTAPWMTVVGIVGDIRSGSLEADSRPQMYRCAYQTSNLSMSLVVRSSVAPESLTNPVRRAIREVDTNLPVFSVQPMNQVLAATLIQRKASMRLLGIFALLALVLSAVGVYGVMAYAVEQRTAEIGIRVALGAARSDIFKTIMQNGAALTGLGVLLGVGGALLLTRYLAGLLFGVSPVDAVTFAATAMMLATVSLLACYIPARRAMNVDPIVALRHE